MRGGSSDTGDGVLKLLVLRSSDSRRAVTNLWSTTRKNCILASVPLKDSLSKNLHNSPSTGGSVHFSPCSGKLGVHANCQMCVSRPVCATRCCLFAPPSVSPNSPLPCFAKAVPVSSTNKRFSSYLCSGHSREDGSWWETERLTFCWSSDPVGCICKGSTAVDSLLL